jgi:hypothetical protein
MHTSHTTQWCKPRDERAPAAFHSSESSDDDDADDDTADDDDDETAAAVDAAIDEIPAPLPIMRKAGSGPSAAGADEAYAGGDTDSGDATGCADRMLMPTPWCDADIPAMATGADGL